jgi:hypothetical protein
VLKTIQENTQGEPSGSEIGYPSQQRRYHQQGDAPVVAPSLWSNSVVVKERGTVDYVIRTGVDVTAREEAQEQVRDSDAAVREFRRQAGGV